MSPRFARPQHGREDTSSFCLSLFGTVYGSLPPDVAAEGWVGALLLLLSGNGIDVDSAEGDAEEGADDGQLEGVVVVKKVRRSCS